MQMVSEWCCGSTQGQITPVPSVAGLADALTSRLVGQDDVLVHRAATEGLPVVTGAWVAASFADGDRAALETSDVLTDELLSADELVLVSPVYNFGVPASMKAWIDQVVRAGRTFQFGETGPVGLATAQRAWIVTASAAQDRQRGRLQHHVPARHLGFIGITDVRVIAAAQMQMLGEAAVASAYAAIETELASL